MLLAWLLGDGAPADILGILGLALVLDLALGDPPWLYRVIAHPVVLIGRLVSWGDRQLYGLQASPEGQAWRGVVLVAGVTGVAALLAYLAAMAAAAMPFGWLIQALLASSLLAWRGLGQAARTVAEALDLGLAEAREAVSHIVGRDPESLDHAGVARATIESIAENFSDGVVAPAFWFAVLGLPGLAAYKAINTIDSMIGYKSARYLYFGRAAARLDDLVNWLPARLAGALLALASFGMAKGAPLEAWRTMRRDARLHRSPNAGWQEAAVAGALGFALAGPRRYGAQTIEDAWMGRGHKTLGSADVRRALVLYNRAAALLLALVVGLWWLA